MPKLFDSVQATRPRRNKFDLSHEYKTTFEMGKLVPILCKEIVPGDSFRVSSEIFIRLAPMLAPVMHRMDCTVHYFFVPNRLIWDEWEDFVTGGPTGLLAPVWPTINFTDASFNKGTGSLMDYFALPTKTLPGAYDQSMPISALPFRAYQTIYNEYYRDQNLITEIVVDKTSGVQPNSQTGILTTLRARAWEKDYFTSALPWAQRGNPVTIPFGGFNDVPLIGNPPGTGATSAVVSGIRQPGSTGIGFTVNITENNAVVPEGSLYAQTSAITNATASINDLRRSMRLQEWLEKNARGGARYIEQILSHFGVASSDARLQRPEYLGGGKTPIRVQEVVSTFQSYNTEGETDSQPQGYMAGHAISVGNTNQFKKTFEEHGLVIAIASVLPQTGYMEGIERMWSRDDKFDYYWPEMANIGEQEVLNKELYFDPENPAPVNPYTATFGYQSRYAEYKFASNRSTGLFRDTLSYWTMDRIFGANQPALNGTFVQSDPTSRIFPDNNQEAFPVLMQCYHHISAIRPMPYYGTPSL